MASNLKKNPHNLEKFTTKVVVKIILMHLLGYYTYLTFTRVSRDILSHDQIFNFDQSASGKRENRPPKISKTFLILFFCFWLFLPSPKFFIFHIQNGELFWSVICVFYLSPV